MKTVLKIISQTNIAERIVTTGNSEFKFNQAKFFGIKGFVSGASVNNTSNVHIGLKSNELPITLSTGENKDYNLNSNKYQDLQNFFIVGNENDGCYVVLEV